MSFKDHCVLVTGAAHNTGFGIARRFAAEGARVWLNDCSPGETNDAVERIRAETGGRIFPLPADLADASAVASMFATLVAQSGGRIDVLVNNAAQQAIGQPFLTTPLHVLEHTIRVNLVGAYLCGQYAARVMAERGRGAIVQLGSNSAVRAIRDRSAYVATKGALDALVRAMALELGPLGIRVNCVIPGYIHTERWQTLPPERAARRRKNIPLGREASADDIADAVLFLASDRAACINGSQLTVDGGCLAQLVPVDLET